MKVAGISVGFVVAEILKFSDFYEGPEGVLYEADTAK